MGFQITPPPKPLFGAPLIRFPRFVPPLSPFIRHRRVMVIMVTSWHYLNQPLLKRMSVPQFLLHRSLSRDIRGKCLSIRRNIACCKQQNKMSTKHCKTNLRHESLDQPLLIQIYHMALFLVLWLRTYNQLSGEILRDRHLKFWLNITSWKLTWPTLSGETLSGEIFVT